MSPKEELVAVYTARQMEAQIIKGRLESEGIPALLRYESLGLVYGFTTNGLGMVRIMVPEHLAKEAREILGIGDRNNTRLQDQKTRDTPTWFKPLCLTLLVIGILGGAL